MKRHRSIAAIVSFSAGACAVSTVGSHAADFSPDPPAEPNATVPKSVPESVVPGSSAKGSGDAEQTWNWHVQNTDIGQYQPSFPAQYSGPNSLLNATEARETVSLDILVGRRLWKGAEFHIDGLMWQGYGLSKTLGIEGFPNAEAYRYGVTIPNVNLPRVFVRQVIGLGGGQETVEDDALHLAGKEDVSRITITVGKMSVHDIFDVNRYANDPRTQFLNWGLTANLAWDYPADSIGYITGLAAELNEPDWAARYGFFQMPRVSNGLAVDQSYTRAWGMVAEFERRFAPGGHPGAVRLLAYLNSAHMRSYQDALNEGGTPDVIDTRAYRYKFGFALNLEQEICKDVGAFARLGWSDGRSEAWAYSDVDESASAGFSFNGDLWHRPNDTIGLAGIVNGISKVHQEFLEAGGTGILAGDGALDYGLEQIMEVYYDFAIRKGVNAALDYQYVANPAFNQARGPVSVFGLRLHFEF